MGDLNISDLATKMGRKRVAQRFNDLFVGLSHTSYARRLNVSERTARSLRTKDRTPHKATAQLMFDNIVRLQTLAGKDEAGLVQWAEEIRRAHEKKQLQIEIERVREEGICKDVPHWFSRAEVAFEQGQYDVAAAILQDRLAPEEASVIDPVLKPYALNRLALAMYYRGRVPEAIDYFQSALRAGLAANLPRTHIVWFRTNLAGALIRKHEPEPALEQCFVAIEELIAHLPAYYVGLCAADALRDPHRMAIWIGRTIQVGQSGVPSNQLQKFVDRAGTDPDLVWARSQSGWVEFIQTLQSIIASRAE